MVDSMFENTDYSIVRIRFRTSGEENMVLYQGRSDRLKGPSGATFVYAWKTRDEQITNDEFDKYGATGNYGDDYEFGTPSGGMP